MADETKTPADKTPDTNPSPDGAAAADRIDPRLDNRRGAERPPLEEFPAKPQQIDGPELGDPAPRSRRRRAFDDRPRKGMKSTGPHGLGNTSAAQG